MSTPIIPTNPSRPIKAKGKDAGHESSEGVGIGREKPPQGVNIASEFTNWVREMQLLFAPAQDEELRALPPQSPSRTIRSSSCKEIMASPSAPGFAVRISPTSLQDVLLAIVG